MALGEFLMVGSEATSGSAGDDPADVAPTPRDLEPILRMSAKALVMVVALVASVYALLPQVTDLDKAASEIRTAQWPWVLPVVLMAPITFLGAAWSISGATPGALRWRPTVVTQVASAFTTKLAPSTVGGMTLNIRFLQRQGIDRSVATASVGLNAMSGSVVHTLLLVVFCVAAGRSAFESIKLPTPRALLIGVGVVVVVAAVAFIVPSVRHIVRRTVVPTLRRSADGLLAVLHRPSKMLRLLGGNAVVALSLTACFVAATKAFDGRLGVLTLCAVYLAGSSVAIIAPTPGGLGAIEAALVGALVAAGMPAPAAVPAVFLFRLVTFWLTMLPGWFSLVWLRHRQEV
jgi:glycosyltransferase 2 family protein